jgi:putative addiction module killer protein
VDSRFSYIKLDVWPLVLQRRQMFEIQQTAYFALWFAGLKDRAVRGRITARIERLQLGNPGDVKPVGDGLSELRLDFGPGYRLYFTRRGERLILLLCGGTKRTQPGDISRAKLIAAELE